MVFTTGGQPREVAVIGLGAWGSALALYCSRLGHSVTAWHRDETHIASLRAAREISITKDYCAPLPDTLRVTSDLAQVRSQSLTIVALPASAWAEDPSSTQAYGPRGQC
jgi:glycerol-3-phosphate dehydrogenase